MEGMRNTYTSLVGEPEDPAEDLGTNRMILKWILGKQGWSM
jgi:hypothetical protein